MKVILSLLTILLISSSIYCCSTCGCAGAKKKQEAKKAEKQEVQYIDKEKLQTMMKDNKDLKIIDVLGPDSYVKHHIKGAINIPLGKLKDNTGSLKKDDKIVVYCANSKCQASTKAAKLLMENGFKNVYDYKNGIAEWTESKLPSEKGKRCKCGAAKGSPSCCK